GASIAGLEKAPATKDAAADAKAAFSDGTRYAAWSAAGFLALGLAATLTLGRTRAPREERDRDESSATAAPPPSA
ncbi:MAG: MFS transporter, partial [Microbacterium sp.]|nr:MFS transporter [Microbacterium sp.]